MPPPSNSDLTLQQYLDSLLAEPAAPAVRPSAEPPLPIRRPLPPVAAPEAEPELSRLASVNNVVTLAPARTVVTTDAVTAGTAVPAEAASPPVAEAEAPAQRGPAEWQNGRPSWAQDPFEVLLFTVGGLKLAVPLVELGAIQPLAPEAVTPLFGQAEWFMGMTTVNGAALRVVDTARVVMPERYQPEMRNNYRYVVSLHDSDWALAVDDVADAMPLGPEQVRWRTARAQRLWLAGTVVEHMCALLDPAQLSWTFQQQDRRRQGGGPSSRTL